MKRKSIALLCIVLSLIILQINVRCSNAQEGVNLFDEILLQTKSKTVEYGLTACFKTVEQPEEICNYLIRSLEFNNREIKLKSVKNGNSYCIEFSGGNVEGYIEALKYKKQSDITINIRKKGNENGLVSLKNKVNESIGYRGKNIEFFQYLKAEIVENSCATGVKSSDAAGTEDIDVVNERIIKILKSHGTENIETISINNGLTTVAYTGEYEEKINNNKLIDFNYAICNYSSGRYIIIGTPEIITTY